MNVLVSQLQESVLCTLPWGEQVEITMLCAYEEEVVANPNIQLALDLLVKHFHFTSTTA